MSRFIAGLVIGAVAAGTIVWMVRPGRGPARSARPRERVLEHVLRAERAARTSGNAEPAASEADLFAPGVATLGVGDGYVFGERGVATGEADVVCLDIHGGVDLACPKGAAEADVPLAAVGLPSKAAAAAALASDAPIDFPLRQATLVVRPAPKRIGVAFVRAASGKTYKVYLLGIDWSASALERRARIGYEAVPARRGGGVLKLPTTSKAEVPTEGDIQRCYEQGRALPGDTFADQIRGKYVRIDELPPELVCNKRRYILVDAPLTTTVKLNRRGALFAAAGVAPDGHVVLDSYSALGVRGLMEGTVDVKSYSFLHMAGDLVGTVNIGSYATVVIEGDLRGTLRVRSYTTLFLRGRILGTLDTKSSGWCTFYLYSYLGRADLEGMGDDFGQVTVHLRESDLAPGSHKDIGSWREVVVGDKVWAKLGR